MFSTKKSIDCTLNAKFLHTNPVYSNKDLNNYYKNLGICEEYASSLSGFNRYMIENNEKPIGLTLQGCIYDAIDISTGRAVVVKTAQKNLVDKHLSVNGKYLFEDIRNEAKSLWDISKHKNTDAGFSKFVDFFEDNKNYYLVTEHCGTQLLGYIRSIHPFKENQVSYESCDSSVAFEWRQYIQYHFRFIAKFINFLHNECGMAHLDLSLENVVIDDTICRIIDFGLAIQYPNWNELTDKKELKSWKYDAFVGKRLYQSPEILTIAKYRKNGFQVSFSYNPQSADIWALGVMLFIMLTGAQPWYMADDCDSLFNMIFYHDNGLEYILKKWKSLEYVDASALDLLKKIFVYESDRIDINGIMNHEFVKNAPRLPNECGKTDNKINKDIKSNVNNNNKEKTNTTTNKNKNEKFKSNKNKAMTSLSKGDKRLFLKRDFSFDESTDETSSNHSSHNYQSENTSNYRSESISSNISLSSNASQSRHFHLH